MPRFGLAALVASLAAPAVAAPVTRADLKPALVFAAAEADGNPTCCRLEPAVALTLGRGDAPHPRSAGGHTFTWTGHLNVVTPGKYRFSAPLLGKLTVTVGDKTVFAGSAAGDDPASAPVVAGDEIELTAGIQPFRAELTRTGPAVRVDLFWVGPGFRPEPLPYFFFGHLPAQWPDRFAADLAAEHGRLLFEEHSCARCHRPAGDDPMAKTLAERAGPDLTEVGRRAKPGWLAAWLADPHKLRPNTAMPQMFADDATGRDEAAAVAAYLSSLGGPVASDAPPENRWTGVDLGRKLYVTAGCATCHGDRVNAPPTPPKVADDPDADPEPELKPEDSVYAVGTAGPRGYYRLGAVGNKFSVASLAKYLENPLASHPHGRMPNMALSADHALALARFLTAVADPDLTPAAPPEPTPERVAAGKRLFAAKGCAACHEVKNEKLEVQNYGPSLAAVRKAGDGKGCLAESPDAAKVPAFRLDAGQRAAVAAFLADGLTGPGSPAPGYHARVAVKRFNCLNCHNRDGEGGIPDHLADRMKELESAENADDIQPPRLTGAGRKLRSDWLRRVLLAGGRARPWMSLRMPQYGEAGVGHLVHGLPELEGATPDGPAVAPELSAAKVEAGRLLTGKAGFGCVACHDISGVQGGGTRGPDLAEVPGRVRPDWFARWLHQPQRLAPGTRMPQNFLDGQSPLGGVLGGDADAQIAAMWAYYALGPGLPLPDGIEPPGKPLAVAVKDRPEVLRTFMPGGAGSRAFAVGYPGGLNLAFDAAECRTAYAWAGQFLDAAPVWADRGGNPAKPLGHTFWAAPAGHPWAVTAGGVPDFAGREADPAFGRPLPDAALYAGPRVVRFAGVSVAADGRPTFRYRQVGPDGADTLTVAETPAPLPVTVAAGLSRTFAVDSANGRTVWLRAAVTPKEPRVIDPSGAVRPGPLKPGAEVPADGVRVVAPTADGKAAVLAARSAPAGTAWHLAANPKGGWDVLLRLPAGATRAEFAVAVWGLAKDDDRLVAGLAAE